MIKVVVTQKRKNMFCADRPELPGSPYCGYGRTWKEALGDLLLNAQKDFGIETIKVVDSKGQLPLR